MPKVIALKDGRVETLFEVEDSAAYFALVIHYGNATYSSAGNAIGVRPAFKIRYQ